MTVQRIQNVVVIWLDNNIDDNNADYHNTITELRGTVNDINTFTDADPCIDFLTDIYNKKVCLLISDSLCQNIIPFIHDINQLHTIFIFGANQTEHEQWIKGCPKIKGAFTEISPICEALKQTAKECEPNGISIGFIATGEDISKKNLDQLDPIFMYSQILKEILLTITFGEEHIQKFIDYCRAASAKNDYKLTNVTEFQRRYHNERPIWWYTGESFLYPMLNSALRLMDMDIIINMGFFICDLHRDIDQLHSAQFTGNNSKQVFTVYRGQGMSKIDFDKMTKTQGGLISFNNFLSTSKDREVSFCFAESSSGNSDLVGILFIITIDPAKSTTPFASIGGVGYYGDQEDEVLFSMHTVFRIAEITPMVENPCVFQVQLTLTSDDDKDLRVLADHIRKETGTAEDGWLRLGVLLLKLSESAKAQQVYEILLEQTANEREKGGIYHQLGWAKHNQGEYNEAIAFYEKALKSYTKLLSPTDLNFANCYNDISAVYYVMGNYRNALSYYEKALEILKESLPSDHPNLGSCYNNIALVYKNEGDYPKALSYYEKALEIQKQLLPANHPSFGQSYNNIGAVYDKIGDYPKALSYHEKALDIRKLSLPSNHPDLGMSYNNLGIVYYNMSDYRKALPFHEIALEIRQKILAANHPDLGESYNNIGLVYASMCDYPKALSSLEKALEIKQHSLSSNHPDLGSCNNNIGTVYEKMGDYPKALSYYEKALEIRKQSLSSNHPDLGSSYNNIGAVYYSTGDYVKAFLYYEKGFKIRKQSLPTNHPDLGQSYNNIGLVYSSMGDYPKALSYHEKALEIRKQSLSSNHSDLGSSYNNIGAVYYSMGDYSKALSYHKKALGIRKQSLPSNHFDLGSSYNNLGNVYARMGDDRKALSYYEKALEIQKQLLPSNHPDLGSSYNNIGSVHANMNDYPNACWYLEQAVEIGQHSLPVNDPTLKQRQKNLDSVKMRLQKLV